MKQGDTLSFLDPVAHLFCCEMYKDLVCTKVTALSSRHTQYSSLCMLIINYNVCSNDACTKKNDTEMGCRDSFGTPSRRKALATTEVHVRNGYRVLFLISTNSLVWFRLIDEKILRFSEGAASIVIPFWWFSLRFCQRPNRIGISSFCNVFLTGKTQGII